MHYRRWKVHGPEGLDHSYRRRGICSIDGCAKAHYARNWCYMHYGRWKRKGTTDELPSDLERFWSQVDVSAGPENCWFWTGNKTKWGYGQVTRGSRKNAHRWLWEHTNGPVPEGFVLDHTCHNIDSNCAGGVTCRHRACVNLTHLEVVTHRINLLRGKGVTARNAAAVECPRGHPYDETNTKIRSNGYRVCRICEREWWGKVSIDL